MKNLIIQSPLKLENACNWHVCRWFDDFREADFARSGDEAKETISLKEGNMPVKSNTFVYI